MEPVLKARIAGIEYALPRKIELLEDFRRDNPDWDLAKIFEKTGIRQRYISAPDQTAADLCCEAAEKIFASGEVAREEIDGVLFCTQSPDYALPTTACILHERLKLPKRTAAFDFNLGCSGFVYGLAIAASMLNSALLQTVLLLCGDTYTKYIDPHDRTCRPIFSDGGSATLLRWHPEPSLGPFDLGTDGSGYRNLIVPDSGARGKGPGPGTLHMEGAAVFLFTLDAVPRCVDVLLKRAELSVEEIDLFVFHQASRVVLEAIVKKMGLPAEKVLVDLESIGNTVSATIPIALKRAAEAGRLKSGQRVLLLGFGVGYSWGGCLVQWV